MSVATHFRLLRLAKQSLKDPKSDAKMVIDKRTRKWFMAHALTFKDDAKISIYGDHGGTTGKFASLLVDPEDFESNYEVIMTSQQIRNGKDEVSHRDSEV